MFSTCPCVFTQDRSVLESIVRGCSLLPPSVRHATNVVKCGGFILLCVNKQIFKEIALIVVINTKNYKSLKILHFQVIKIYIY